MYSSELGRRLRHQSSSKSLNNNNSDHPSTTSLSGRRSPAKLVRPPGDMDDYTPDTTSFAASSTSGTTNSDASSSHLTEIFAAQLAAGSSSMSSSNDSASLGNGSMPGSFDGSSHAGPSSLVRSASPTRRAAVSPHYLDRPRTPSKRANTHVADRYLPTRQDSDEQAAAFQLLPGQPTTPHRQKRKMAPDVDAQREEADHTFANLLGAEIFGRENQAAATAASTPHSSSVSSTSGSGGGGHRPTSRPSSTGPTTPTKRNLFSYSSPSSSRSRSAGASGGGGGGGGGSGSGNSSGAGGRSGSSSAASSGGSRRTATYADDTMRADRTMVEVYHADATAMTTTPRRRRNQVTAASSPVSLFGSAKRLDAAADDIGSPLHRAYDTSPVKMESQRLLMSPRRAPRTISKVPFKVLDAPDLADDFYLNLVDWSSSNTLAVGLNSSVYLWSASDSKVQQLVDLETMDDKVTSLSWAGRGHHLAVGTSQGNVQIWDAETLKLLRTMRGHSMRVGALAWNEHILSSGSRDRTIFHRDVRVPEHHIRELNGHKQEVCNLEWNTETNQLASGGNDNKLLVWDALNSTPLYRFSEHSAAVKAIAWSPHQQGILASGGGTADMKIRFWNTLTGALLSEVDTGSQVCNLMWSRTSNEVISTHGYSAGKIQNQIQVWRYPSMQQVATLTGHTMRVLYLAMSPDGETIVTGAGDETLRFWDLNTPSKGVQQDRGGSLSSVAAAAGAGPLNPFAKLR